MSNVVPSSGYVAFKPRARLLKLIGSELISDDVVAVTELVKNAHDADATEVVIRFDSVTMPGGTITVIDDGHGMDRDVLLGGWMEPAGSTKRGDERKVSPKGRWMLGEKGLGRFAADKLGSTLELVSRRHGTGAEVRATFDWDRFEDDEAMLGEVKNHWEIRPAQEIKDQGTLLRIGGLRSVWTERMFRRLSTRLSRLRSPFQTLNGFAIRIESDEFPEYSKELGSGYLDDAPYRMDAQFDGRESLEVRLNGARPIRVPWTGSELGCGPVRIRLHAFDLETDAIAKIGPRQEVRGWLREWSGISIYRDGFRVWPYGEPHDDWLRLDQRRVNNPVVCLSNNQVVGFVEISQKENPELRDQTNREGLIHNTGLEDLRKLMHFALQLLESERQSVRHPQGRENRARREAAELEQQASNPDLEKLKQLAESVGGKAGSELRGVANRLEQETKYREAEHRRSLENYVLLAARGYSMPALSANAERMVKEMDAATLKVRADLSADRPFSFDDLLTLENAVKVVQGRLSLLTILSEGHSNRRRAIEVPAELRRAVQLYKHEFKPRGLTMKVKAGTGPLLRVDMSPERFHLLLNILLQNAMDWTEDVSSPEINVQVSAQEHQVEMLFSDNGPGVPTDLAEKIFEPTFTLREGGQGMGLTIARTLLSTSGGSIEAVIDRRRKGATFRVLWTRKRSRAT